MVCAMQDTHCRLRVLVSMQIETTRCMPRRWQSADARMHLAALGRGAFRMRPDPAT
jgi:hypothetical protein